MSGELIAHKVISKVNARLKFFHQKNKYVTPNLCCLICNALIQSHFDYACSVWYPYVSKLKTRIQTSRNKSIRFCRQLDWMSHISQKEFETIYWLPIQERYNQCRNSVAFKYFYNQCSHYLNEVFMKAPESISSLRNSYPKLQQPFHKTNTGQNVWSFIGLAFWNQKNN